MRTFFISALLLLICTATFSCKDYSTGLQQGASRADETSAIATLRTIAQAQTTYSVSNAGHYGSFEQLAEAGLLDSRFNHRNPEYHGYVFTMEIRNSGDGPSFYTANADPGATSINGGRHFYLDSDGLGIRVSTSKQATNRDEILRP